jgi:hypothetical protein
MIEALTGGRHTCGARAKRMAPSRAEIATATSKPDE